MSKLKNHSLLILMAMIVLIMMPMSFASDVDTNTTIQQTSDVNDIEADLYSSKDILSSDESVDIIESSSNEDVLSSNEDYQTKVNPSTVDFENDGHRVQVTTTFGASYVDSSSFSGYKFYAWINGESDDNKYEITIPTGYTFTNFYFDLDLISDKLNNGENTITFHHNTNEGPFQGYVDSYDFQKLTVTVSSSSQSYTGIIYVDENGSNDNDGSEITPVATIDKAIELATDGNHENKIIVNEGTYTLSNAQLSSDLNITGKGKVVVAPIGNNYHMYLGGNYNYEINNLIFVNGTKTTSAISMGTTNKKVKINNCSFINNTGYNYIIYSYGQVTITNCNFINNTVKAGSNAGVIYADRGSLDVSYSNFINNKNSGSGFSDIAGTKTGSGWDVSYTATISAENNYWGSNNGPSSSQYDKDNLNLDKYVQLLAVIDEGDVTTGNSYDINLKFTDKNGNELSNNMPDLTVDVSASGILNTNNVIVTNNIGKVEYTAGETGEDIFTVKINDNTLTTLPITIVSNKYTGIIYVANSGSNDNDGSETSPVATIAKAIELAADGDHETKIIITEGTYAEHDLTISSDLEIIGQGNVIIDANKDGRIFEINSAITVKLTNLTLTNAVAPKKYDSWYGDYEDSYGGAIYVKNGVVEIDNLTFAHNTADNGGAIYIEGDKSIIANSKFENNNATNGGAIYIQNSWTSTGNTIKNNVFNNNNASNNGGAIIIVDDSDEANIIDNNTFTNNIAISGGAIRNTGYTKAFNNTFNTNKATNGAAISSKGYLNLNNNVMTDNEASENGNDIYVEDAKLTGQTAITFINGDTLVSDDGKAVALTAKVTDDNGNTISGGYVEFTLNSASIGSAEIINGLATLNYNTHENGTFTVSGSYDAIFEDRVTLVGGTLEVSNAVPEYFGIIYIAETGDDDSEGSEFAPVYSLTKAIALATREGGSNKIVIRGGTYKVSTITLTDSINITGEDNPILDAERNNAIFVLKGKETTNFIFSGLTFANGYAHQVNYGDYEYGGAIYVKGGNLYLYNDKFVNNTASMGAGAIYINQGDIDYNTWKYAPTTAIITGCEFENNGNGKNYGGAIYASSSNVNVEISDSTFIKNSAGSGGAIYAYSATVNIADSYFNENNASGDGGAIYIQSASATIKNNEFNDNNASGYSSSIYIYKSYNNDIILEKNTISSENSEIYTNNLNIKGFIINILDGETQTFCEGDITLYATVVDDNYNRISSGSFTFVINTTEQSTSLDNGEATIVYNAKLSDNGSSVSTTITSSEDGVEVNPGILEILEYNVIFDFEDETGHVGKTLRVYVESRDAAGKVIKDNLTVSFNGDEFEVEINEDDVFEFVLQMPETPQTLDLKVSYGEFSQTHTVNVVEYYDGVIYVSPNGNDENNGSENAPVKTIGQAIMLASDSDNIAHKIIIGEGTYNECNLEISSALEIIGQGNVIIDAQKEGRIFYIEADTNISGITFKNGKVDDDGGAIYVDEGKVSIDNSKFYNNNGTNNFGGAIYWKADNGKLTNSIFEENSARNGAAIQWSGSNGEIINCTFNNNDNIYNAAGCIGVSVWGNYFTVKDSNFTNNHGRENSDNGVLFLYGSNAVVDNCLFENNTMDVAGAIKVDADSEDVKITNSKFINNKVYKGLGARSGAIEMQGTGEISNNIFIGNGGENCSYGGAIAVIFADYYGGDISISNNEFINNSAYVGGAIYVDGGLMEYINFDSLTIEENTFTENTASYGSSIYAKYSEGPITIQNNDIVTAEDDANPIVVDENTAYSVTVEDNSIKYVPTIDVKTNNPSLGENATITVNISEKATGNVTITVGNNDPVVVNITNGIASLTVSDLAIGEYNVSVTYNGDDNYNIISSKTILTVSKVETPVDEVLNTTTPSDSKTPTYSINLPKDATGNFTVIVDGKVVETKELVNGSASITVPELATGNHNITVSYSGDSKYAAIVQNTTVSVPAPVVKITNNKNINMLYTAGTKYTVRVTVDGKAVVGQAVTFNVNGKKISVKTDKNGYASVKITLAPKAKKYTVTATYGGKTVKNTVKVNSIIKAKNMKAKKSAKVLKIKVTLKKVNGKYIKGKKVTLKFKGKTYKVRTNKKGVVTFKVKKNVLKKLKVGKKYTYKVIYGKDTVSKKITVKK